MKVEEFILNVMIPNNLPMVVFEWKDCPFEDKWDYSDHGGDEDFLVISALNSKYDYVIDQITVCDRHDTNVLGYTVSVTAHA